MAAETDRQTPVARAIDGTPLPPAANNFSDFVRFQEDGQLNAELTEALKALAHDMMANAIESGGKAKGKMSLTFDFSLDGRVFSIGSKFKVDLPDPKRPKSIMWATEDGRFTPSNPHQGSLFGVREVRGGGSVRDA
jgi:hypothetical protein